FPQDGANVNIYTSSVVFVFSESMDTVDVRSAISVAGGYPLDSSTITWQAGGSKLVIQHPVPLSFGTTYQIVLNPAGVQKLFKDKAGFELDTTTLTFIADIKPRPNIALSVSELKFTGIEGSTNPASKKFVVSNVGDENSVLNWVANIKSGSNWLSVVPSSGSLVKGGQQEVNVSVNISGLTKGEYTDEIEIVDNEAVNSPQKVKVVLEVLLPVGKFAVKVYVKDNNGRALSDVKLKLKGTNVELIKYTDANGVCEFKDVDGYKEYVVIPSKTNYEFTPSSITKYINADVSLEFVGRYVFESTPQQIDIPLGSNDTPVTIDMPKPSDVKIVVEERTDKPKELRGTVNPDRAEEVGIVFKPDKKPQEYIGQRFTIRVFTLNGELVEEFYKTPQTADDTWVKWLPKNIASGTYIVYVEGPGVKKYRKVVILR
ncbi:MAG: Ig-like domain-containing protein, partial [Elusimicrobiota bacterium]|nr:Ig-like domain-containing protein [Elusimicrobiota bacterium]